MSLGTQVIDTAGLLRVGGPLGSSPAGLYQDAHGRRWYVKTLETAAHARNERLAAALYALAGAPTLRPVRTTMPEQVATEWVMLDKASVARFSEAERRQARHWLGVHAWTANWDAVGLHGDNQGVAQGQVLTLDVGGALAYRAQGDPKGRAFGTQVAELDTLRTDLDNPQACRLFGDMDEAELADAIRVVTQIPVADIRRVVAEAGGSVALADQMVARQADMARRLTGFRTASPPQAGSPRTPL